MKESKQAGKTALSRVALSASRTAAHAVLALTVGAGAAVAAGVRAADAPAPTPTPTPLRAPATLSSDAKAMVQWIRHSSDNERAPFIVIDKRQARLWLFDSQAQPLASTPVLLGLARGDHSVPGIGERPLAAIERDERTTPAGRFIAEPGHNANGEDIFWIDYDAAVSMHRVRAVNKSERRLERLASESVADNRITYGCINVPAAFYDQQIQPLFGHQRGVVYVLPEAGALGSLFNGAGSELRPPVNR